MEATETMNEEANATELRAESERPLVTIERENTILQIVFGAVVSKLPHENFALSILAELPHGQGKQTILEGSVRAFLDLAAWAAVEGILNRDAALLAAYRRIHDHLRKQDVKVVAEPPRPAEVAEGAGDPSMALWGPEVERLIRRREPFSVTLLGTKKRVPLSVAFEQIGRGAVLFYYDRMYYVLKTAEYGNFELSFHRPEPKRAIVIAVDLEEDEAERVANWAKYAQLSKPEVIRVLVRGLPKTTRGGRIAIASGVFSEIAAEERRRIERLVKEWEKQARDAAAARTSTARKEARKVKHFMHALQELGRGRFEQAVAHLDTAVKEE